MATISRTGITAGATIDPAHITNIIDALDGTSSTDITIIGRLSNGNNTTASAVYSHAEGLTTLASASYSHAEGLETIASGLAAHAEGRLTLASGIYSHAEGYFTTASGQYSHAEGRGSYALGQFAHAEGYDTYVSGAYAHAMGLETRALGNASLAAGYRTTASNGGSSAFGEGTQAYEDYQFVVGEWNSTGSANSLFIVGKGTSNAARSNAFRVSGSGNCFAAGTFTNTGADYAEYFESFNGQTFPAGTVVELTGSFIKICETSDNAIGVISTKPNVLGNSDEGTGDEWVGKYEKDVWGNYTTETYERTIPDGVDADGNIQYKTVTANRLKLNANFDPNVTYIPRSQRPEWNVVGLLGQIKILKNQNIPTKWIKMKDINDEIALYLVR